MCAKTDSVRFVTSHMRARRSRRPPPTGPSSRVPLMYVKPSRVRSIASGRVVARRDRRTRAVSRRARRRRAPASSRRSRRSARRRICGSRPVSRIAVTSPAHAVDGHEPVARLQVARGRLLEASASRRSASRSPRRWRGTAPTGSRTRSAGSPPARRRSRRSASTPAGGSRRAPRRRRRTPPRGFMPGDLSRSRRAGSGRSRTRSRRV